MASGRRKFQSNEEPNKVINDLQKIYVYKRKFNLIAPIPYIFKIDWNKLNEIIKKYK